MPISCRTCKKFTTTTEPVMIKRLNAVRYCIFGLCNECGDTKYKFLNNTEVKRLPAIFYSMPIPNMAIQQYRDQSGKCHEIMPLVSEIIN